MGSISSLIALLSYGIALCGTVPLFPWLETAPRLILAVGLAAGIWQDLRGAWTVKNWLFNAAIVPLFLYYAFQFSHANPVQPVVSVLAVMLAARLAGPKNARHYLQISALSLFCLASSSLFDLSPLFLAYLVLMLLMVAVLLVLVTFYSQDNRMQLPRSDIRKVLLAGLLMPLASLPLLLLFFPILPRTQFPLWNFVAAPSSSPSGFNDQVEPGKSTSIAESGAPVFRAEMQRQPQQQLYWRGTVFNRVEGQRWLRVEPPPEHIIYRGQRVIQTIYPEPGVSRVLPALSAPAELALQRSRRSFDGVYEYSGRTGKRFTYRAESVSSATMPVAGEIRRSFYLALPENQPPRIRQLAADIRRKGASDAARLEQLEIYFRNGGFSYSKTGLPTGERALEKFLFESKQGHCEFFAASFALILRSAGVPARIVGGYLGGEYNDLGGYYLVREEAAHVWVEVFINGTGWVRVDPSSFAQNAGAVWGRQPDRGLMGKLRLMIDSLDHTWNSTVITYDLESQISTARAAGKRLQGLDVKASLTSVMGYLLVAVGISAVYFALRGRKYLFPSREERLLRAFYRRVRLDCSVTVERGRVGLLELADLTGNPKVRLFTETYAGAVYRDRRLTEDEFRRLRQIVRSGFRTESAVYQPPP